jgi:hypothetical protein
MAKIVREIPITRLDAQNDPKFAYQQSLRDDDKQILSALNLKMNSEVVKTTDVFTNLAPQTFKMAGVTADDARVSSSGASVSTAFSVTGTKIIISNVLTLIRQSQSVRPVPSYFWDAASKLQLQSHLAGRQFSMVVFFRTQDM